MSFNKEDIQIMEKALEYYDNNERNNAIKQISKIPFFKHDINWFIGCMIQDLDYADKGIKRNDAREYIVQAIEWIKKHQGGADEQKTIN